jgi:hypothetical protein
MDLVARTVTDKVAKQMEAITTTVPKCTLVQLQLTEPLIILPTTLITPLNHIHNLMVQFIIQLVTEEILVNTPLTRTANGISMP